MSMMTSVDVAHRDYVPPLLLSIDKVALSFGAIKALDGISFDIRNGEILSIVGPNGSGKTSMLNVISGFYSPQEGTLAWMGGISLRMRPFDAVRQGIIRTFQEPTLFAHLSVFDNVMTGRLYKMNANFFSQCLNWGIAARETQKHRCQAEDIIDFLEMTHICNELAYGLSYALQKRIGLARALAMEPRLLLLDEPMAGLNHRERKDMRRLIQDINRHLGITIVLIEHDMGAVMALSDRVVVLDCGQKIAEGFPEEVQFNPLVVDTYLGVRHDCSRLC